MRETEGAARLDGGARFLFEPRDDRLAMLHVASQHLERDAVLEALVHGLVNAPHAPASDEVANLVFCPR